MLGMCGMKRPTQVRLMQQLLGQVQGGATVDAGCVRSAPMSMYTCPDLALQEWQEFYCQMPMLLGLSNSLATTGSAIINCSFGVHVLFQSFWDLHGSSRHCEGNLYEPPLEADNQFRYDGDIPAREQGMDQWWRHHQDNDATGHPYGH